MIRTAREKDHLKQKLYSLANKRLFKLYDIMALDRSEFVNNFVDIHQAVFKTQFEKLMLQRNTKNMALLARYLQVPSLTERIEASQQRYQLHDSPVIEKSESKSFKIKSRITKGNISNLRKGVI
jgi:hypothetical protein